MIEIGDIVKTTYNSGTYIGKVIEDRGNFFLVEVLAVVKHPEQGDLHRPKEVEGVAFHERKALAYTEKFNARKRQTDKFSGEVPDYKESLKNAVSKMKERLQKEGTEFAKLSLEKLRDLETHYYDKIYNE